MSPTLSSAQITILLADWGGGHREARVTLIPVVYDELRDLALHYSRRGRPNHTLQSCAVVNEAYLRLAGRLCHEKTRSFSSAWRREKLKH